MTKTLVATPDGERADLLAKIAALLRAALSLRGRS